MFNPRQNSRAIDPEFASQLRGLDFLNFDTEDDFALEARAAAEVARLAQELGEEPVPKTPNLYPFARVSENEEDADEIPVIATLATKASRRKRTIGAERPLTAPSFNQKNEAPASLTTGFQSKPLSKITETPQPTGFPRTAGSSREPLKVAFQEPKQVEKVIQPEENLSPRKMKLKILEKAFSSAVEERESRLAEQKLYFEKQLNSELEALQKDHEENLNQLKEWFDSKKSSLENYKTHQEKISSLAEIISRHSQTVNSLSTKFSKEREYTEDLKVQELSAKERALDEREKRLLTQMQIMEQDKLRLTQKQKIVESLEEKLQKLVEDDKVKLLEEQKSMNELQETLRQQDREKKQTLALEMHRLSLFEEQVEREEKAIEEEIKSKENDIVEKQSLMEIEKNESYSQIQHEKGLLQAQSSELENFRRSIPNLNADLNKRLMICEEKAKQLKVEAENLRKAQELLTKDKGQFEKEGQRIHEICLELDRETESMMDQRQELERKKKALELKRHEVLSIKEKSRLDRQRVDKLKQSLQNRKRVYESLKAPARPIEFPRSEVSYSEVEPYRASSRPRSVAGRSNFKAAEYLRDLDQYHNARDDIQNYIVYEGNRLLNSKLDYETGVSKALQISAHGYSTPASSGYRKASSSLYINSASFAKPDDSQYIGSSFYKEL